MEKMDYVIKNHKDVYIRLNQNGTLLHMQNMKKHYLNNQKPKIFLKVCLEHYKD